MVWEDVLNKIILIFFIGQTIPERRGLDAVNLEPFQYEVGTIPAEWEGNFCIFSSNIIFTIQNVEEKSNGLTDYMYALSFLRCFHFKE